MKDNIHKTSVNTLMKRNQRLYKQKAEAQFELSIHIFVNIIVGLLIDVVAIIKFVIEQNTTQSFWTHNILLFLLIGTGITLLPLFSNMISKILETLNI